MAERENQQQQQEQAGNDGNDGQQLDIFYSARMSTQSDPGTPLLRAATEKADERAASMSAYSSPRPKKLDEIKHLFMNEHSVTKQDLESFVESVNDENIKWYTRAEWRRKFR